MGGKSIKDFVKDYYIVPKGIKYENINITTSEEMEEVLKEIDLFADTEDIEELKDFYIIRRKTEKKLNSEEVQKIKRAKGSVREKAKKFGVSIGTISKINNDKY